MAIRTGPDFILEQEYTRRLVPYNRGGLGGMPMSPQGLPPQALRGFKNVAIILVRKTHMTLNEKEKKTSI